MIAASYDNWLGLAIGAALIALLVAVLIMPERF
jgi:K+-transporting ATPase KdpF subunit